MPHDARAGSGSGPTRPIWASRESGERPPGIGRAGGPAARDGQWHGGSRESGERPPGIGRAGGPAARDGQWHGGSRESGERPPGIGRAGGPAARDGQWHGGPAYGAWKGAAPCSGQGESQQRRAAGSTRRSRGKESQGHGIRGEQAGQERREDFEPRARRQVIHRAAGLMGSA